MASKTAVGSAAWIAAEKENVYELLQQEKEEVTFPAQHELEWLNEHMKGIFTSSHVDVANVFKTPGKLKGKTPRTARKRNAEPRIPLSDVFSSKQPSRPSPNKVSKTIKFTATEDIEVQQVKKSHTDSGYHGSSQVEEIREKTPEIPPRSPLRMVASPVVEVPEEQPTLEGSFHPARRDQSTKVDAVASKPESDEQIQPAPIFDVEMQDVEPPPFDDIGSPSDESTPDRPVVRKKSSMTFASLPAREPLKNSIGARVSRTSHVAQKRDSRRPSLSDQDDENVDSGGDGENVEILGYDESESESETAKQYSKASTQRLQERIDALGKVPAPRPSKSIPSAALAHPTTAIAPHADPTEDNNNDDDDWIKPLEEGNDKKLVEEETEDEFDVRAPELIAHEERMREVSPSPRRPPLGYGKSASTATLSSPGKMAMAPPASPAKTICVSNPSMITTTPQDSPSRFMDGVSASKSRLQSIMKTAKGLFTSSASVSAAAKMETLAPQPEKDMPGMYPMLDKPLPASPGKQVRRTRSSAEREKRQQKDVEAMHRMDSQLRKARDEEQQKAKASSPRKEEDRPVSKMTRPMRPTREMSKTKPQPVSIKIMPQRMPVAVPTGSHEVLPAEPKRPGLVQKGSTASLQSVGSTMAFKTSVNSQPAKPRALIAAERRKELDEKEAQRKLDQKKEVEKKRAAQQEELRRREQEQRTEAERKERERLALERAKRQAQQQAIEKKRIEAAKKVEQQRNDRETSRPPSRLGQQSSRPLINHQVPTNPAKPAKRPLEEEITRPQAPKFGAASQLTDAKRRRTEDEAEAEAPSRPTMSGAPIRQSQLGKKPSIFNHPTYQQAPLNQFPPPPRNHQMAQYATARIPFAEPVIAPTKTPVSAYQHRTIQTVKSSPQYQNGESIHLPEIPTDSEDEDSEEEGNAFPIPDWATPGHLTEQLIRQEGIDGDAVFGPIAPLKMEEIFAKGNKERLKRLRDRTSSANWAMSGDGLTLEEVRHDREQREKLRQEGGWRYGS